MLEPCPVEREVEPAATREQGQGPNAIRRSNGHQPLRRERRHVDAARFMRQLPVRGGRLAQTGASRNVAIPGALLFGNVVRHAGSVVDWTDPVHRPPAERNAPVPVWDIARGCVGRIVCVSGSGPEAAPPNAGDGPSGGRASRPPSRVSHGETHAPSPRDSVASITNPQLPDESKARLRDRARLSGRSLESLVRTILDQAARDFGLKVRLRPTSPQVGSRADQCWRCKGPRRWEPIRYC